MLERRLKLGTFLGIGLYVHWTFALMIVYVGYMARSEGWFGVGYGVAQLLGVFLCVTLHEYGHAMAARWFGVPTLDITLLPIGGVARLQRMPRIPIQEFIVAVAGPAVNVVIVIVLATLFLAVHGIELFEAVASPYDEQSTATLETMLTLPTPTGFAFSMLIINLMLVVFNMIPAFPMDGGRVLRSLLAMFLPYRRATYVASRVGLVCAAGMAIIAWYLDQPMPILIAFFVGYAGMAEARQVEAMETVRGLNIARSMIRRPSYIDMNTQLLDIAARWEDAETPTLPVVSGVGGVVGVIRLEDVAKAIQNQADPGTTAGMLADHGAPVLRIDDDLESVLVNRTQNYRQLPVVDRSNQLVGVLDLDSMLARGVLGGVREQHPNSPPPGFDAFS